MRELIYKANRVVPCIIITLQLALQYQCCIDRVTLYHSGSLLRSYLLIMVPTVAAISSLTAVSSCMANPDLYNGVQCSVHYMYLWVVDLRNPGPSGQIYQGGISRKPDCIREFQYCSDGFCRIVCCACSIRYFPNSIVRAYVDQFSCYLQGGILCTVNLKFLPSYTRGECLAVVYMRSCRVLLWIYM